MTTIKLSEKTIKRYASFAKSKECRDFCRSHTELVAACVASLAEEEVVSIEETIISEGDTTSLTDDEYTDIDT